MTYEEALILHPNDELYCLIGIEFYKLDLLKFNRWYVESYYSPEGQIQIANNTYQYQADRKYKK